MGLQVFGSLAVDVSKVIAVAGRSVLVQGIDSTLRVESDTESVDKLLEYLAEVVKIQEVNIKDSNERIGKLFEELMNYINSRAVEVYVVPCVDPDCKLCKPAAVAPVAPEVTSDATSDSLHSDLPVDAPVVADETPHVPDFDVVRLSDEAIENIQSKMNAYLAANSVPDPPSSPAVAIPAEPIPVEPLLNPSYLRGEFESAPVPVPAEPTAVAVSAAQPIEIIQPDPVQSLDDVPTRKTIVPEFDLVVKLTPVDSLIEDDLNQF